MGLLSSLRSWPNLLPRQTRLEMKKTLPRKFFQLAMQCVVAVTCLALLLPPQVIASTSPPARPQGPSNPQDPAKPQDPAESKDEEPAVKIPADQLDALVAPIALYPDNLLAQTLTASTYPLEIVQLH